LSAAFELTASTSLRAQHDVTVYQLGWRLGGKGASSRDPSHGWRIEEHGLHVWGGFYENAFDLVKRSYAELNRDPSAPLSRWQDAFRPQTSISWQDRVAGQWLPWTVELGTNSATPGEGDRVPEPWEYLVLLLPWMARFLATSNLDLETRARTLLQVPSWVGAVVDRLIPGDEPLRGPLPMAAAIASDKPPPGLALRALGWLVEGFREALWRAVGPAVESHDDLRRTVVILDLASTYVRGMIRDDVLERGFSTIDRWDYRAWLARHGASKMTLESAAVRSVYDFLFAYVDGDVRRPSIAAGVALRMVFRLLFTWRGAVFWKVNAGMGEAVFAPLYQVLSARGVRFRFFHQVERLHLSRDRRRIQAIRLRQQATLASGVEEYQPLVEFQGRTVWPYQADWQQLEGTPEQRQQDLEATPRRGPGQVIRLVDGQDFDDVVLAIPVGALGPICGELSRARARWRRVLEGMPTAPTLAVQLWLNRDLADLGWRGPAPVLTGFADPLDTWGDLSHLLEVEDWDPELNVKHLAYLVGTFQPRRPRDKRSEAERAFAMTRRWLVRRAPLLWPGVGQPGAFPWDILVDSRGRRGCGRLRAQVVRANVRSWERYVLSVPGTSGIRLRAEESGFENLVLAGDWTRTGLDFGCMEAAVMSGRQASRALCGVPRHVVGEHDVD
jgi:uncharacterized protein with NAD-binding domain and iron-sulfur cluster